jgi:undecaprenyl diphosphate synthase
MTALSEMNVKAQEPNFIDLSLLDLNKTPRHIAIIMDGNRRWAKQRGLPPMMGHWEGAEVLTDIVRAASEMGVKTVTVYAFSTENWHRPNAEIEALMNVFEVYLERKRADMVRDGIRLDAIGDLRRLPSAVQEAFQATKKATEGCSKINLVLAMNYGGRDEIRRAMVKILSLCKEERVAPEQLTEQYISSHLDTAKFGDPELLIRTSGELRISNFLIWQVSYAEIYTTDVLWPDFSPKHLFDALLSYQGRSRRRGG